MSTAIPNQFKGTPGPWIKRTTHKGQITAVIPKKFGERVVERVLFVGNISDDDCGVETCCCVEEHSNARLIAAAPDLLESLQNLMNHYDEHGQLLTWNVDIARQAINKALNI